MSKWDDAWKKPDPQPPQPGQVTVTAPAEASSYAVAALRREADLVAATPNGQRNATLNKAAFRMGRHVGAGNIDAQTVIDTLADAGRACGLPDHEIDLVLRDNANSGLTQGTQHPRHPAPRPDLPILAVIESAPELEADEEHAFWDARPLLRHLHDFARARRVSPWAVLGVALARICTATPYFVVLPPIVGGHASLNLFVGLVGRSGAGKGAAESVAAEAVDVGPIETHTTGSGEGIAHGYKHRTKGEAEWNDDYHAVLFSIPEIDTLSALGNRQGATLMPELRRGWSGERLGFAYADPTKRLPIEAHKYRMCLIAGIQPGRASTLLDDSDGGTPQRFLWLPAVDPHAPDQTPECPDPLAWTPPRVTIDSPFRQPSGKIVMHVCDTAARTIDQSRLDRLRGSGEALDGHGLLTRLKVAAALALSDNARLDVNDDDWALAGLVHKKSDATRAGVQADLRAAAMQQNEAKATAEATRTLIVNERVEDAAAKRVARATIRSLRRHHGDTEWVPSSKVRTDITSRDRGYFEAALIRLADAGQIDQEEGSPGMKLRLAKGYRNE